MSEKNDTAFLKPARPALTQLSLRNKIGRGLWSLVWLILFRPSPVPLFKWRCFLLRLFGGEIHATALPYPSTRIWAPWNLTMLRNSCLASEVDCYNVAPIHLGEDSIVSQKSYLCSASHDIDNDGFALTSARIEIGTGSWVAADSFIGPGVSVGDFAVVGARTVLSKSLSPGAIVVGNPAKFVRWRRQNEAQ